MNPIEAQVAAGDSFRESKKLPMPAVVKIDVEGFEYHVLQGLRHTLAHSECRLLCCEVHTQLVPKDISSERILGFVRSLGFSRTETYNRYDTFHLLASKAVSCPH